MEHLERWQRDEPLTYYSHSGPIGHLFRKLNDSSAPPRQVAVVGLGAGSLAAYARLGQDWTFYEIDPVVVEIARNYFHFLADSVSSRKAKVNVVIGDGRLRLEEAEGRTYDLLVIDAFNSDSIPTHLLTREAIAAYREHLTDDGILAFHISNRFLDMEPVLATLADDAGLAGCHWFDGEIPDAQRPRGRYPSHWVLLCKSSDRLRQLTRGGFWGLLSRPGAAVSVDRQLFQPVRDPSLAGVKNPLNDRPRPDTLYR